MTSTIKTKATEPPRKRRGSGKAGLAISGRTWMATSVVGMGLLLPSGAGAQQSATPQTQAPADAGLNASPSSSAPTNSAPSTPSPTDAPSGSVPSYHPAASGNVDNARYIIGSDDVLQITVWKEPTLSGTVPVRPDGMISMVLLGDVPATGMTPMQLSANIGERLKKFIQDPSVTVVVSAVNSQKIFLIGEVHHVGPITLFPGMTPLQAISAGGGLTNFANGKRIYILRSSGGKQEKIPFNYKLALKGDSRELVSLHPGDTIVVP